MCVLAKSLHSCLTLCDPMDWSPPGSPAHGDSPGTNTGDGCHDLLHKSTILQQLKKKTTQIPILPHHKFCFCRVCEDDVSLRRSWDPQPLSTRSTWIKSWWRGGPRAPRAGWVETGIAAVWIEGSLEMIALARWGGVTSLELD